MHTVRSYLLTCECRYTTKNEFLSMSFGLSSPYIVCCNRLTYNVCMYNTDTTRISYFVIFVRVSFENGFPLFPLVSKHRFSNYSCSRKPHTSYNYYFWAIAVTNNSTRLHIVQCTIYFAAFIRSRSLECRPSSRKRFTTEIHAKDHMWRSHIMCLGTCLYTARK